MMKIGLILLQLVQREVIKPVICSVQIKRYLGLYSVNPKAMKLHQNYRKIITFSKLLATCEILCYWQLALPESKNLPNSTVDLWFYLRQSKHVSVSCMSSSAS